MSKLIEKIEALKLSPGVDCDPITASVVNTRIDKVIAIIRHHEQTEAKAVDVEALFKAYAKDLDESVNRSFKEHMVFAEYVTPEPLIEYWLKYAPIRTERAPHGSGDVRDVLEIVCGGMICVKELQAYDKLDEYINLAQETLYPDKPKAALAQTAEQPTPEVSGDNFIAPHPDTKPQVLLKNAIHALNLQRNDISKLKHSDEILYRMQTLRQCEHAMKKALESLQTQSGEQP